ncbi:Na+/H+ antiporter NhaC [Colwelliaceae bacterium 6471]
MTELQHVKTPSMLDSFIPLLALILMLSGSVYYFGDNSTGGPNQIALMVATGIAAIIGIKNNATWAEIEKAMVHGISISMGAIFILLAVGALIGTWMLSGTVPTMIYFGLKLLNPDWFYPAACIICGIVALSIGSSWTTAATIGVALMGIASGLGLDPAITAGAVISGAYFGDKISPLSETTNLAPVVAGSELFSHIRYMMWTTLPSITISLTLFTIIGFTEETRQATASVDFINQKLVDNFNISIFNLLPLVLLLTLAIKKVPAFPSVAIGALVGALWAVLFQSELILRLAAEGLDSTTATITVVWTAFFDGVAINSGDAELNDLLSGGGMGGMLKIIWLVMCALMFGAVLEHLGMLKRFVSAILSSVKSVGGLIASTIATCIGTNIITADQYMAIVMPGRMYKEEYKRRGLDPLVLSRTLEDSGTLTSPLIPWNTCGAFMFGVLALTSYDYIFYCFFNLINPILAIGYGFLGFKIKKLADNA